ncbi:MULTISPECIES: PmeII family type II restriction endonuclease [Thermoprotei]|uniref:PmeII family type II restriction endonuclease n=1 Tax=Thermoprotei TaxID=183924 RepID=UPI003D0C5022
MAVEDPSPEIKEKVERALVVFREFSTKVADKVKGIKVDDILEGGVNPYLFASLGVKDFEDVAYFFVQKRVERSLGTSFGSVIEEFLRELLGGKSGKDYPGCMGRGAKQWVCWWDIVIEGEYKEGGTTFRGRVVSVKSGPANINKDILSEFAREAAQAEGQGYRPYLALTYGPRAFNVVNTLRESLRVAGARVDDPGHYVLVGRKVYEVLLGQSIYDYVIKRASEIGVRVDLRALIDEKVQEITEQLRKQYKDVNELLRQLS